MIVFEGSVAPVGYPGRAPTIRITVGLPGCGKSTMLRLWEEEDPDHRVVVGRDDYRRIRRCLPVGTPAQEASITVMMDGAVESLLRHGWDVGVDSTHIQPGTLRHWREVAGRVGARVEISDLTHVTVDECVRRDEARRDAGGRYVGAEVIRAMAKRYLEDARREIYWGT